MMPNYVKRNAHKKINVRNASDTLGENALGVYF